MGKFLIVLFIISRTYSLAFEIDPFLELLNPKAEAIGSTGMVFGKEYGSLYLSPTAYTSYEKFSKIESSIDFYNYQETNLINYSINFKVGDLKLGFTIFTELSSMALLTKKLKSHRDKSDKYKYKNKYKFKYKEIKPKKAKPKKSKSNDIPWISFYIPMSFAKKVKDINIGVGFKIIHYSINSINTINKGSFSFISYDLGLSYESYIGNFTASLSNLRSFLKDLNENIGCNLRLGYGKEFKKIGYLALRDAYVIDSFKIAIELHDLLMQGYKRDYAILRNICLGFELSTILGDMVVIDNRFGLKNFFPTYGLCLNMLNIILEYTFTNKDLGKKWGKDRKNINMFSISFKI